MQWRYQGLTLHGFRRSCVIYYREHGASGNHGNHRSTSLEVFGGYKVVDFRAMQNTMQRADLSRTKHVIQKSLGQNTEKSTCFLPQASRK
jgi:hypothetical protein